MTAPREAVDPYAAPRAAMVIALRHQIADERVLAAFRAVPRERFVIADIRHRAYEDAPLPIGYGQTISQPLVVAIMLELLELSGDEKVLDVGTGSGYQAALLSHLAREVISVERIPELAAHASEVLAELAYPNVTVHEAGDVLGWPEAAPYDAIVCGAAAPDVPESLVEQLSIGGRLVMPIGERHEQEIVLVERGFGETQVTRKGACRFVPLIGQGAFPSARPAG